MSIPCIDLSSFVPGAGASAEARAAAAVALDTACSEVGFFHLFLPGLAEAGARLLRRCREFHALPGAAKRAVSNELSPLRRGYNAAWASGGGSCAADPSSGDPPDPKETFMLGSEGHASPMHGPNLWPREAAAAAAPAPAARSAPPPRPRRRRRQGQRGAGGGGGAAKVASDALLRGGHKDPCGDDDDDDESACQATTTTTELLLLPHGWRAALESDWHGAVMDAARVLALALAAALGEPEDAFADAMRDPAAVALLLRYDPSRLAPGSKVGCGAHTDCGFLTLLFQEPGAPSPLQVQRGAAGAGREGAAGASGVDERAWVDAPARAGHVLVNLGDMVARWTNERYRSTTHRVLLDDVVGAAAGAGAGAGVVGGGGGSVGGCAPPPPRYSVACFANPTFETRVACLPTCCAPAAGMPPARFEPTTAGRYISRRLGLMYADDDDEDDEE
jgi:isopenicillin N synthase-like dioxygenase